MGVVLQAFAHWRWVLSRIPVSDSGSSHVPRFFSWLTWAVAVTV